MKALRAGKKAHRSVGAGGVDCWHGGDHGMFVKEGCWFESGCDEPVVGHTEPVVMNGEVGSGNGAAQAADQGGIVESSCLMEDDHDNFEVGGIQHEVGQAVVPGQKWVDLGGLERQGYLNGSGHDRFGVEDTDGWEVHPCHLVPLCFS